MNAQDKAHLHSIGAQSGPLPVVDEEPTPLIHEIPLGDPFPLDAMGPLKAAAEAIQDRTQAPAAIGAQSLLAAASLNAFNGHDLVGIRVWETAPAAANQSLSDARPALPDIPNSHNGNKTKEKK